MTKPVTALVMAARGKSDNPVAAAHGVANKCLVEVDGSPMLHRVVRALAASPHVASTIIVCEEEDVVDDRRLPIDGVRLRVAPPAPEGPVRSVLSVVETLGLEPPILVTTGDHPLLTTEMIAAFIAPADRRPCGGLHIGVVAGAGLNAAFPGIRRTWWRLRDGLWSGCNLYAPADEQGIAALRRIEASQSLRKRPLKFLFTLGIGVVIPYLLRLDDLEGCGRRLTRRLGAPVRFFPLPFAEAAIDGDSLEDLALIELALSRRRKREE